MLGKGTQRIRSRVFNDILCPRLCHTTHDSPHKVRDDDGDAAGDAVVAVHEHGATGAVRPAKLQAGSKIE